MFKNVVISDVTIFIKKVIGNSKPEKWRFKKDPLFRTTSTPYIYLAKFQNTKITFAMKRTLRNIVKNGVISRVPIFEKKLQQFENRSKLDFGSKMAKSLNFANPHNLLQIRLELCERYLKTVLDIV